MGRSGRGGLRIAMVSTPFVSVPPARYGGTELVVSELVKGLTLRGHEVVLFATGDSRAPCPVRALFDTPAWPPHPWTEMAHASWVAHQIATSPKPFDLIHAHSPAFLGFSRFLEGIPLVYTLHHDRSETQSRYYATQDPGIEYIAISERQASLHKELPRCQVIHHGLDPTLYPQGAGKGNYLAFLGRLSHVKGPDTAIEVATALGMEIRLGGGHHEVDGNFYQETLLPLAEGRPNVHLVGELSHDPKVSFLGEAAAVLFPIRWEEPFGLVMIESMLCGSPVVAFAGGAVTEVVEEGVTGFIAKDPQDMARLVRDEVPKLDRSRIRERALERFSCHRMVDRHLEMYRSVIEERMLLQRPAIEVVSG